jgi:hypothetical protein
MMSEKSASYYARYLRNVALAEKMDNEFPDHEGWTSVIRFYAAVHLMNAYLVDKKGVRFDPESADHAERTRAMARCPELRDAPRVYRWLKDLSEVVRYRMNYDYSEADRKESIAWLEKIVAIVEPKLKRA